MVLTIVDDVVAEVGFEHTTMSYDNRVNASYRYAYAFKSIFFM